MINLFKKGVTLLELMVAAAILVMVISGLLITFISCMLMNEANNNLVIAVNDAQYAMEQIKGLAYDNILSGYTAPSFTNLNNENITTASRVIDSYLKEVTVNVTWTERGRNRLFSLSTRIAHVTED